MSVLFTDEQLSKATASRQDGISQEDEEAYRAKTNEFVTALTRKLDMCVFACVRVCVRACVRVCVRACAQHKRAKGHTSHHTHVTACLLTSYTLRVCVLHPAGSPRVCGAPAR